MYYILLEVRDTKYQFRIILKRYFKKEITGLIWALTRSIAVFLQLCLPLYCCLIVRICCGLDFAVISEGCVVVCVYDLFT